MLNITAAQYIFSVTGVIVLVCGLCCCFIPKFFKSGVLSILLADMFFGLAIVFPKKVAAMFASCGASEDFLSSKPLVTAVVFAVVVSGVWFALLRFCGARFSKKTQVQNEKDPRQRSAVAQEQASNQNDLSKVAAIKNKKRANPKIFDSLRGQDPD